MTENKNGCTDPYPEISTYTCASRAIWCERKYPSGCRENVLDESMQKTIIKNDCEFID
jgi:hypothetical protein